MRSLRRDLTQKFVLAALWIGAAGLVAAGCGPSPLRKELDAYKQRVTPLLEQEQRAYDRLHELAEERDAYSDPYQDWIATEGISIYERLVEQVVALAPKDAELRRVHEEFVDTTKLMVEFLHREFANRELYDKIRNSVDAAQLELLRAEADRAVETYGNWLEDPKYPSRVPGWQFRRAKDAQERYQRIDDGLGAGTMDVAEAKRLLRDDVLVIMKEAAEKERFFDDEGSRKLEAVIVSARRLYTQLLDTDVLELQAASVQAAGPAQEAIRRATAARTRFVSQFRKLFESTR